MSDSRLRGIRLAPWHLDHVEWAAERLPFEDVLVSSASGHLPLVLDADGEEIFAGGGSFGGGGGGGTAGGGSAGGGYGDGVGADRELRWEESGADLLELGEPSAEDSFAIRASPAAAAAVEAAAAATAAAAAAAASAASAAAAASAASAVAAAAAASAASSPGSGAGSQG